MEISQIPNEFLDYMKELLKDDYSAFYNYLKSEDIRKSVTINKSLKEAEIMALESAGFEKIDMLLIILLSNKYLSFLLFL